MPSKNQLRVGMGVGVVWMILGVFWGFNANVWLGVFSFALGVAAVFDNRRRIKLLDATLVVSDPGIPG